MNDLESPVEATHQENSGIGHRRVNQHSLARWERLDTHAAVSILFCKQRRNVGLEETSTDTQGQKTNDESGRRTRLVNDDIGRRGSDEDNVSHDTNNDGNVDRLVTSKVSVSNITTNQWHEVASELLAAVSLFPCPIADNRIWDVLNLREELVEQGDTLCSTLTHAQCTGLTVETTSASSRSLRKWPLYEVGV